MFEMARTGQRGSRRVVIGQSPVTMATAWTQGLLDEARRLTQRRDYLSALRKLLVVLDVYPREAEALGLASLVAREGSRRSTTANPGEVVLSQHLYDSRLDPIFCSCDAPGCQISWVSAHYLVGDSAAIITNPLGAACQSCGITLCRNHLPAGSLACRRCGRPLNTAPPPNGRSGSNQTPRLNKPLVHVIVLVEEKREPTPEFLTELCENVAPDVYEDSPRFEAMGVRRFENSPSEFGLAVALASNSDYGSTRYDLQIFPGQQAGRKGQRWVIVKIFENRPKHVDPGY